MSNSVMNMDSLGSVSLHATFDDPGVTFVQNVQSDQFDWSVASVSTNLHSTTL